MAPIKPSTKARRTASTGSGILKQHTSYPTKQTDSAFTSTKKDKRIIKHSLFMSKVHDSGIRKPKRRRPGKKLVTNLESLGDALEEVAHEDGEKPGMRNVREGRGQAKRREKVVREERERFGLNMAVLSSAAAKSKNSEEEGKKAGGRWAALRAHIQASAGGPSTSTG